MTRLNGRVALVTGSGRGIGRAIAIQLAVAGAKVIVSARSRDELDEVMQSIRLEGGQAESVDCDLSDRSQSLQLISEAAKSYGPIDILINNAGIGSSGDPRPIADFRDEFWDSTLELNLTVPYLLAKAALPHMRQQQ